MGLERQPPGEAACGIAVSIDTTPAHEWVRRKQGRHAPMLDVPVIELYADEEWYHADPF